MALNHDASKVIIGDSWNGSYYLFNFADHTCQTLSALLAGFESPLFSSSDGEYAVASAFWQIEFINFESGQIYNTWNTGIKPGWPLCVSPTTNKLVAANGGNEYLFSFNFKEIEDIFSDTTLLCGEAPEADSPVCAELLIKGFIEPDKIVTANSISQNLTIIDFDDHQIDTLYHFVGMSGVKIVPGSRIGIVYGRGASKTWVVSLDDGSVLTTLNVGQVGEVFITSDGLFGYLIIAMNPNVMIVKININSGSSTVIDQQIMGGNRCDFDMGTNYVHTVSGFSPDEQLLLFGHYDLQLGLFVNIVDAVTLDLLAKVPVPDECIYEFAFTGDSKRVLIMGYFSQLPIIYLDRENSYLENLVELNYWGFSSCFNPTDEMFYVLEQNNYLHVVDPMTGFIRQTFNTCDESNTKVAIDQMGLPVVLTSNYLIYDGEYYPMPGPSSYLTYYPENDLFLIPVPGPDVICVFDPKMVGIQQFKPGHGNEISIFPNPATDQVDIKSSEEITHVEVCNIAGTKVFSCDYNERKIEIPTGHLAPGVYLINIKTKSGDYSKKVIVGDNY